MTINLTPEQESRLQAIMSWGAYASVEEVVEAALAAVEQRTLPGFAGTPDQLDALLAEGLAFGELAEKEILEFRRPNGKRDVKRTLGGERTI